MFVILLTTVIGDCHLQSYITQGGSMLQHKSFL